MFFTSLIKVSRCQLSRTAGAKSGAPPESSSKDGSAKEEVAVDNGEGVISIGACVEIRPILTILALDGRTVVPYFSSQFAPGVIITARTVAHERLFDVRYICHWEQTRNKRP